MTMKNLLEAYYDGLQKRSGWEDTIAEDFEFVPGSAGAPTRGKAAYAETLRRFGRVFETVSIRQMTIQGDSACVVASYRVVSPSGRKTTFDIAEVWTARGDRLASLRIYFDTAAWQSFMAA